MSSDYLPNFFLIISTQHRSSLPIWWIFFILKLEWIFTNRCVISVWMGKFSRAYIHCLWMSLGVDNRPHLAQIWLKSFSAFCILRFFRIWIIHPTEEPICFVTSQWLGYEIAFSSQCLSIQQFSSSYATYATYRQDKASDHLKNQNSLDSYCQLLLLFGWRKSPPNVGAKMQSHLPVVRRSI